MVRSSPRLTVQQVLKALTELNQRMMTDDSPAVIRDAVEEYKAKNAIINTDTWIVLQELIDQLESRKEVPTKKSRAAERVKVWANERGCDVKLKAEKPI